MGLLVRKSDLPVAFVAKNLSNLPAVTFNNIDVSTLLGRMEAMRSELDLLKSTVAVQASVCEDLQSVVNTTVSENRDLQGVVSSIVASNMKASTEQLQSEDKKSVDNGSSSMGASKIKSKI